MSVVTRKAALPMTPTRVAITAFAVLAVAPGLFAWSLQEHLRDADVIVIGRLVEGSANDLIEKVESLGLGNKREWLLTGLLTAAKVCLEAERPRLAVLKLRIFRGVVNAWKGGHLTRDDARCLRRGVNCVIRTIRQ